MNAFLFTLLLFAINYASDHAPPSTEQLSLATELVKLYEYDALFTAQVAQCEKSSETYFNARIAYETDPDAFRGLTPSSKYWSEIENIYKRYQLRICNYLSQDAFVDFFVRRYAEQLSADDLRSAIVFQKTSVGKRLQEASASMNEAYAAYAQDTLNKLYKTTYLEASREVNAAVLTHQRTEP